MSSMFFTKNFRKIFETDSLDSINQLIKVCHQINPWFVPFNSHSDNQ